MNYDPYAPPRDPAPAQQGAQVGFGGGPVPWNAADAIGRGWELYKPFALVLSLAAFVTMVIGEIPAGVDQAAESFHWFPRGMTKALFSLAMNVAGWILAAFIQSGLTNMMLKAARGIRPSFADAFGGGRWFLRMLLVNFLTGLLTLIGLLLLVVPGIIVALGLTLAPYLVVDQDLGPIEAMTASWEATKGHKGDLFLLALLSGLLFLLGMCVLGFGIFVAMPVIQLATCVAYMSITGRGAPAAAPPPQPAPPLYVP